jgi:hypothetical protein
VQGLREILSKIREASSSLRNVKSNASQIENLVRGMRSDVKRAERKIIGGWNYYAQEPLEHPCLPSCLYQPTATSKVFGFEQPMSLEYPPASLYGKAYCCMLMAWASIHCA